MMIVRFRDNGDHEEMLKKVKKMKKFAEELEDCLEEAVDEPEYRDRASYHREYDDDDEYRGRYGYKRDMRR